LVLFTGEQIKQYPPESVGKWTSEQFKKIPISSLVEFTGDQVKAINFQVNE
jgi:hypothetical protein